MKLLTNIPPRADNTVLFRDGKTLITFVFDPASGSLVADVEDEKLVVKLLQNNNFSPADEADYDLAEAMLQAAMPKAAALEVELPDGDDDDDDDEPADPNALPVEANTPPVAPAGKSKPRKAA